MSRVYNFSAGPSTLPLEVLKKAHETFLEYGDSGMSVMEMSHRTPDFDAIMDHTKELIRQILSVPDNYKILFLQGGGTSQFSMIPLNLMKNKKADFIDTGKWTDLAIREAKKYVDVKIIASSKEDGYTYIPQWDAKEFRSDADYVYICDNNTVYGTKYTTYPDTGSVPLVADMSSSLMSEPVNVSKFGLIFATAQKNMGCPGVTIVIIREDLIKEPEAWVPIYMNYKIHADNDSMYNTPPTYSIYINMLMMEWILSKGGLDQIKKENSVKAKKIYDAIEKSSLFYCPVISDRTPINIRFTSGNETIDRKFTGESRKIGLVNLEAHKTTGGMRASVYNAMPMEGVDRLVEFIEKFDRENTL